MKNDASKYLFEESIEKRFKSQPSITLNYLLRQACNGGGVYRTEVVGVKSKISPNDLGRGMNPLWKGQRQMKDFNRRGCYIQCLLCRGGVLLEFEKKKSVDDKWCISETYLDDTLPTWP